VIVSMRFGFAEAEPAVYFTQQVAELLLAAVRVQLPRWENEAAGLVAGSAYAASGTPDHQAVRGMEPTGIEPVTSCLQSPRGCGWPSVRLRVSAGNLADLGRQYGARRVGSRWLGLP
jgi:hypothetical protein